MHPKTWSELTADQPQQENILHHIFIIHTQSDCNDFESPVGSSVVTEMREERKFFGQLEVVVNSFGYK